MRILIRHWNGHTIKIRKDRYVSLTDMAKASGDDIGKFLKSRRVLSMTVLFYRQQRGQITHPIVEDSNDIWVYPALAKEFSYQSKNFEFSVWMDDILWVDVFGIKRDS